MHVEYSTKFIKTLIKSPDKIQTSFYRRIEIFLREKYHPTLNNHKLLGKYMDYRSINITGNWRAIFREFNDGGMVVFYYIGAHSELYK